MENQLFINLVSELVQHGVNVRLCYEDNNIVAYPESGFYKSGGCAYLKVIDDKVFLFCRYNNQFEVEEFRDIVMLSYDWYEFSKDRSNLWATPPEEWSKLYKLYDIE